ncbi:MAG: Ulp1 protease family, C-terminal catalytic domain [Rickettsiaceae bacterium]|jgi:hypothetical protein|nr:Ulp1 protease family, C-terminal catalytic domain [Rickettsiaceae bacterium]
MAKEYHYLIGEEYKSDWLTDHNINIIAEHKVGKIDGINLIDGTGKVLKTSDAAERIVVFPGAVNLATVTDPTFIGELLTNIASGISSLPNKDLPRSVITPVNIGGSATKGGNHWVLVVFDAGIDNQWHMSYVDPLAQKGQDSPNNEGQAIYNAFANAGILKIGGKPTFQPLGQQQTDGWACGYITIENAIAAAGGPKSKAKYTAEETKKLKDDNQLILDVEYAKQSEAWRKANPQKPAAKQEEMPAPIVTYTGKLPEKQQQPQKQQQATGQQTQPTGQPQAQTQPADTSDWAKKNNELKATHKKLSDEITAELKKMGQKDANLFFDFWVRTGKSSQGKDKEKGVLPRANNIVQAVNVGTATDTLISMVNVTIGLGNMIKDIINLFRNFAKERGVVNEKLDKLHSDLVLCENEMLSRGLLKDPNQPQQQQKQQPNNNVNNQNLGGMKPSKTPGQKDNFVDNVKIPAPIALEPVHKPHTIKHDRKEEDKSKGVQI